MMMNPSNALSLLRAPLAFFFLIENAAVRVAVVILAMITDVVDGYLARRYQYTSKFGAALDPLMDKFFVYFVLGVFYAEGCILWWQALSMVARDFFLFVFGIYLFISKRWKRFQFHSVRWGKVTTAAQLFVIISLIFTSPLPSMLYFVFVALGLFTFLELLFGEISH